MHGATPGVILGSRERVGGARWGGKVGRLVAEEGEPAKMVENEGGRKFMKKMRNGVGGSGKSLRHDAAGSFP